jgi:hypothetical protein
MTKRALLALAGLTAFGFSSFAQPPAQFLPVTSLLDQPSINSPWLSLENHDRFLLSTAFGSMRNTPDFLPALTPSEPLSMAYLSDNKNSVDRVVDLHPVDKIRFGGEVGFLYGKSTGGNGFGREDYAGYVSGTVGNEHFSITASYYRQETNYSGGRFRR